jgi:N,N'-diacetyllegionaminate synthase
MFGQDKVFIIAEAGVNHNGSFDLACKLVDVAVDAGADAVKFQTWKTENVVTRDTKKALYQMHRRDDTETQFEMLKKLELSFEEFVKLKQYCDIRKIMFLSTADEIESANFLNSIQNIFKVGSSELTDLPYLRKLAQFGKPIILSTGMGDLEEVKSALNAIVEPGLPKDMITILHCTSAYPTSYEEVNLHAMITIKETFDVKVGYSDHTMGIEIPIAAVSLGATVIEKHFTLDLNMEGPDHKSSLELPKLRAMVEAIRNVEKALGDGEKKPTLSELQNMTVARKSIVAKEYIRKGETFINENITVKRPGTGIDPSQWNIIIGKQAQRDFKQDELIEI